MEDLFFYLFLSVVIAKVQISEQNTKFIETFSNENAYGHGG